MAPVESDYVATKIIEGIQYESKEVMLSRIVGWIATFYRYKISKLGM